MAFKFQTAVAIFMAVIASMAVLVAAQATQPAGVVCAYQSTFNLCYRNWQAGGTTSSCTPLQSSNNTSRYNYCMCQQLVNEAYCFNAFCPADTRGDTLRANAAQYCALAPSATALDPSLTQLATMTATSATIQTTASIPTQIPSGSMRNYVGGEVTMAISALVGILVFAVAAAM
ncbi:hypothetical protein HDU76_003285 [Blyttiomyces sp. JEL0837]|nr:hypothetical protein HDU76_003285 [Blyttiomyces sp. JEL0837]